MLRRGVRDLTLSAWSSSTVYKPVMTANLIAAGAFKLAEVDLAPLLPPKALGPFADEIKSRQKRRERKSEQEARIAQHEAAAAADAAAAAASKGLTARELKVT